MADTMMERLRNYFGGDPATTEGSDPLGSLSGGVGRLVDPGPLGGMEDFKESFRDVVAMNDAEVLKEFIRSSMGDMMAIAQDDPAFAVEFYRAANMFPETRAMLPPSLRTGSRISDRDLDAVRGAMEASSIGGSFPVYSSIHDAKGGHLDPSGGHWDPGAFSGMRGEMPEDYYEGKALTHMANAPEPGYFEESISPATQSGMSPMMGMSPDLPNSQRHPDFPTPTPMDILDHYNKIDQYNKQAEESEAEGFIGNYAGGGYVQEQSRPEKENVRPVNRTLSTALSPTLSIKLFG